MRFVHLSIRFHESHYVYRKESLRVDATEEEAATRRDLLEKVTK